MLATLFEFIMLSLVEAVAGSLLEFLGGAVWEASTQAATAGRETLARAWKSAVLRG
ncbi:MAG TPA: hypothetical protein VK689_07615 [Armatimonadota bacterium]|nr:hypothetical protein [Armatimonadota bacterium]